MLALHVTFNLAILVGLLVMMWPILAKVRYEELPKTFKKRSIWLHISISLVLNWIVGPFLMLGLAWATLPEAGVAHERRGVILVGIARCIGEQSIYRSSICKSNCRNEAMVLIWNSLAQGDPEYCAILVCINSILQVHSKLCSHSSMAITHRRLSCLLHTLCYSSTSLVERKVQY